MDTVSNFGQKVKIKRYLYESPITVHYSFVVTCTDSTPANGQAEPLGQSNGQYLVDITVFFTCDSGYSLEGSASSTCQVSGIWDPTTPTCSGKEGNRW